MGDGEDDFTFATEKQRAVLELLANNRTSKEIAGALAVSEPAINRRIEVLRLRLGGITRHQLVRRYRNWRDRIALSGLVALLLLWQPGARALAQSRMNPLMQWLAKVSYAVFLLHYAMSLAVNASVMNWTAATPGMRLAGLVATWLLSLGAGWLAWRWLEGRPTRSPPRSAGVAIPA